MKQYQVKVNRDEALRYLGYGKSPPDEAVSGQIEESVSTLERICSPAYIYRICELVREIPENPEDLSENGTIRLDGTSLVLSGDTAGSLLAECRSCVMMAVTIGRGVDAELHRRQITDMAGAVILDSCASSAVESICEQLEADLEQLFRGRGLYLTDRFSPGYGDLPLALQPEICRALSAEKRIGLSITSGMLLMPAKSVTAFIGISDRPQPKKLTGCSRCSLRESCNYRKAGTTCAD